MRQLLFLIAFVTTASVSAQEYKVVTIVESIVPMGVGRSRIVETQVKADVSALTTVRDGTKSKQSQVERDEIKESGENLLTLL
ncbi:MAG: hypothetical protein O3B82_04550 [Bacteroidetes bacterium]|nr:hypothetical protein [Bacteroidota bacterium]